jgi:2-polyprenyl-6-methoxyphenol hydroxylase-like FAD-dependent oxidoreductase
MALERADINAVVYEAGGPAATDAGPYLSLATSGLAALAAIGADGLVTDGGFVTRGTVLFNSRGKRMCTLASDVTSVTIRRGRLKRLLQEEATRRGIQFEFGKRLGRAAVVHNGVEARFADGTIATGEMLIGCDGVRSVVRQIIDPTAPGPRDRNLLNFYGYTPSISAGTPGLWQMVLGRRACFGYAADPAGGTVWFANVPRDESESEDGEVPSHQQWTDLLVTQFMEDNSPAVELIAAGTLALDIYAAHDLQHVPRWHSGSMIVIGDAAHTALPSMGQGASIAIEDGVVLAKHLRQLPTRPAFVAFEQSRRRRVELAIAQADRNGRHRTPGTLRRIVRDLTLPLACRFLDPRRALAWTHDYRVEWDEPVANA